MRLHRFNVLYFMTVLHQELTNIVSVLHRIPTCLPISSMCVRIAYAGRRPLTQYCSVLTTNPFCDAYFCPNAACSRSADCGMGRLDQTQRRPGCVHHRLVRPHPHMTLLPSIPVWTSVCCARMQPVCSYISVIFDTRAIYHVHITELCASNATVYTHTAAH